jgi:Raf kinase inhibitor-like YbhB/YbcL family protein
VQGANQRGTADYIGPCPPPGSDPHHYGFTLYALSKPLSLESGASLEDLEAALQGKVIARDKLVGTYAIPATDDVA